MARHPRAEEITFCKVNADKRHLALYGLDLVEGVLRDNIAAGVLEPALSKTKIIQVT